MPTDEKREILERSYDAANNCCDHPDCVPWKLADVESVVHAWELGDDGCYGESASACVVLLKNGNYGTVTEWGDTTGHG